MDWFYSLSPIDLGREERGGEGKDEEGVWVCVCLDDERGRVSGRIKILVENSSALKNSGNAIYVPPLNKKKKQR